MTDAATPARHERELTLRYAATCCECATELPPLTRAAWDRVSRTARCLRCSIPDQAEAPAAERPGPEPAVDFGTPGASAQRMFDAKQSRRKERLRGNWWLLAIISAVCTSAMAFARMALSQSTTGAFPADDPTSTTSSSPRRASSSSTPRTFPAKWK